MTYHGITLRMCSIKRSNSCPRPETPLRTVRNRIIQEGVCEDLASLPALQVQVHPLAFQSLIMQSVQHWQSQTGMTYLIWHFLLAHRNVNFLTRITKPSAVTRVKVAFTEPCNLYRPHSMTYSKSSVHTAFYLQPIGFAQNCPEPAS